MGSYISMFSYYSELHRCKLFSQDNLVLLITPCLFSHSLSRHLEICSIGREDLIIENPIEELTAGFILNRLEQFLLWVEEYSKGSKFVSLDNHHNLPNQLLNYYLNEVLIEKNELGEASIKQSIQALKAYFNYLYQTGLTDQIRVFFIKPKFREQARINTKPRTSVKYITPELRNILYKNTNCIRDELLLKTGGECGLRSKENQGFLLEDFRVGNKNHSALLTLFQQMKNNPEKTEFEYYLQGLYSKSVRHCGGSSRMVYLHRDLLRRFKDYFEKERPKSNHNSFFLNNSNSGNCEPITASRATQVFKKIKDKVIRIQELGLLSNDGQMLELGHTHHVLRHSYGTDKFYTFSQENNMAFDDVTTTSQVYLTVAALMGHNAVGKSAPISTANYIRGCNIKESF
jgi:integrase